MGRYGGQPAATPFRRPYGQEIRLEVYLLQRRGPTKLGCKSPLACARSRKTRALRQLVVANQPQGYAGPPDRRQRAKAKAKRTSDTDAGRRGAREAGEKAGADGATDVAEQEPHSKGTEQTYDAAEEDDTHDAYEPLVGDEADEADATLVGDEADEADETLVVDEAHVTIVGDEADVTLVGDEADDEAIVDDNEESGEDDRRGEAPGKCSAPPKKAGKRKLDAPTTQPSRSSPRKGRMSTGGAQNVRSKCS